MYLWKVQERKETNLNSLYSVSITRNSTNQLNTLIPLNGVIVKQKIVIVDDLFLVSILSGNYVITY